MTEEDQQAIALARYAAIAPLVTEQTDEEMKRGEFYPAASEKGVRYPDGTLRHPAAGTIQKWYLNYKHGGFEALLPKARSDAGKTRVLDDDAKNKIRYYHGKYPRMGAAAIYQLLKDDGTFREGECSQSTVLRFIKLIDAEEKLSAGKDMRRYERAHINEVWYGDSSVGPYLTDSDGHKRKIYIIALIDDASRYVVGVGAFFNDNFENLMGVMKSAVAKSGCPKLFSFDNGKPYKNRQMELLAARIGTTLNYCRPYTPTSKAKIERWFRSLKDQWMASLDMRDFHTIDELRGSLYAYVQRYNQSPHSSLKGTSPQDRFFREPEYIRRIPQEELEKTFLLEIERRVSADSVIVIDHVEYEVDCRFARQKIRLRYTPDMKEVFLVEKDGTLDPIRILNRNENASVRRQEVFEENAVEAILNAANGTPRMINKFCNAALLVGHSRGENSINAQTALQAIDDCELG